MKDSDNFILFRLITKKITKVAKPTYKLNSAHASNAQVQHWEGVLIHVHVNVIIFHHGY